MTKFHRIVLAGLVAFAPLGAAVAEGCIELRTVAEVEQRTVDAQGNLAVRRVPAAKVVPGTEVIWTVSARNVCQKAADALTIDSPIPEHMAYVADSAAAARATVSYSLDGQRYAGADALTVREADGTVRKARADEYRAVRFAMNAPLGAGQSISAQYRAVVE